MYRFHYQKITAKYGSKAKLAYTDTYSFVYLMKTGNIHDDMAANIDAFDTSDYPAAHPFISGKNAKILCKFKDECISLQPDKFIELRKKTYSLKLPNSLIKITTQGSSSSHILKNFKHKDYLHTFKRTMSSFAIFRTITSQKNTAKTQEVNKLCLSAFGDKRYSDGVSILANGQLRIPD